MDTVFETKVLCYSNANDPEECARWLHSLTTSNGDRDGDRLDSITHFQVIASGKDWETDDTLYTCIVVGTVVVPDPTSDATGGDCETREDEHNG